MGNCLKTQLKSVVDNDNLKIFNAFNLFNSYTENDLEGPFAVLCNGGTVINTKGDFYDSEGNSLGDTLNLSNTKQTFYIKKDTVHFYIPNVREQSLVALEIKLNNDITIDFSELGGTSLKNITTTGTYHSDIPLSLFSKALNLEYFYNRCSQISGDISALRECTNLSSFQFFFGDITGDFASWAPYRNAGDKVYVEVVDSIPLKCNGTLLKNIEGSGRMYTITYDGQGGCTATRRA